MNDKFIIITIWRDKSWKRMNREVTGMQRLTRRVNYEKASEREYRNTRVHRRQGRREDAPAVKQGHGV